MKFELKNVQYNALMSEETYCFSANLYIDGVFAFTVANRGHGGCNEVRPFGKFRLTEAEINDWLAANREPDPEFPSITHDLEIEVGELMTNWIRKQELNKLLRKAIVSTDGDSLFVHKMGKTTSANLPAARIDEMIKSLAAKNLQLVHADHNYEMALALV